MATDQTPMPPEAIARIAEVFAALADPTRLRLLQILQRGPATVGAVVEASGVKQANVSKQLGKLHDARLLARERVGNQVRYSISDPIVNDLCSVVCSKLRRELTQEARALGLSLKKRRG
jgi:DNA-binding transcriptional ArsR family regulator